ncbi:hypothetical protein GCM10020358_74300 [Amorphoplanes nipponensis]|uniref:response regulator n=1 Tax=Actinoplanes nipponensis TaxID=135950 RepID=UPI0031E5E303
MFGDPFLRAVLFIAAPLNLAIHGIMCLEDDITVDALLTDIIMPGMSGTRLAAELRHSRPDLPVLFMSGYTNGPTPGGQELPPDAPLIRKPFETAALLRELHGLLRPPGAGG